MPADEGTRHRHLRFHTSQGLGARAAEHHTTLQVRARTRHAHIQPQILRPAKRELPLLSAAAGVLVRGPRGAQPRDRHENHIIMDQPGHSGAQQPGTGCILHESAHQQARPRPGRRVPVHPRTGIQQGQRHRDGGRLLHRAKKLYRRARCRRQLQRLLGYRRVYGHHEPQGDMHRHTRV